MGRELIEVTGDGLFCRAGGFHIDPWRRVGRALVTHAHSDHARPGMGAYLAAASGTGVLRERVGGGAVIEGIPFGERRRMGDVTVSFHPAGHLLGSAQIQVERGGEVWVVTGDYKTAADPSCEAFEPVACDTLVTESTFGLPVYRWPDSAEVFASIHDWWAENRAAGRTSILFAYALGKAQRVLCGLDSSAGPIGVHGAVERMLPHYREAGRPIPPVVKAGAETRALLKGGGLVVAPGSAQNTPWVRRFAPYSLGFASGWMQVRGKRRRRALDRGFVLSDHADWSGILATVRESGARRVGVTHGYAGALVRWLREEEGLDAWELPTRYAGERAGGEEAAG
jgi:putative mRNA 3-end processing factor